MLTEDQFENLVDRPESTILDFKISMYDFIDDVDLRSTAKFVKDVICFCNTVRNQTSYIIIGIEVKEDGKKVLHGLSQYMDDAILQEKIKNKVHPRPVFHYYLISYQNKQFGILEFPITKYPIPIHPILKMKGLEIGKVYYRQGTSNTEALALEVIKINDWLQNLPALQEVSEINGEINKLIRDLTTGEKKLSLIISEMYAIAQKYQLSELVSFCTLELKGYHGIGAEINQESLQYRIQNVFISVHLIEINPYYNVTANSIKREFEKTDGFFECKLLFSQSIINVEEFRRNFEEKKHNAVATVKMSAKDVLDELKTDHPVFAYFFSDTVASLYGNIRQKAIDMLMKFNSI